MTVLTRHVTSTPSIDAMRKIHSLLKRDALGRRSPTAV